MALTLQTLTDIASRALGGAATEDDLTHTLIVNSAGRELYSMHDWRMRIRAPTLLDLTADTAFVALPDDFGPIDSYRLNGLTIDFTFTSMAEIARKRDHAITPVGFHYWGAIVQPAVAIDTDPLTELPAWRIEIYPTPTSTQTEVLQLWYRGIWPEMDETDDIAQIKPYQEPLLISLVQAYAEGWIEDEHPYPSERINRIKASTIFRHAVKEDSIMPDVGTLENGAVASQRRGNIGYLPWTAPSIT